MNRNFFFLLITILVTATMVSCKDDDEPEVTLVHLPINIKTASSTISSFIYNTDNSIDSIKFQIEPNIKFIYDNQAVDTISFVYSAFTTDITHITFTKQDDNTFFGNYFSYLVNTTTDTLIFNNKRLVKVNKKKDTSYKTDFYFKYDNTSGNLTEINKIMTTGNTADTVLICNFKYDTNPGIFKQVKTDSWVFVYYYFIYGMNDPYYLCYNNNVTEVDKISKADVFTEIYSYKYDKDGYPSSSTESTSGAKLYYNYK